MKNSKELALLWKYVLQESTIFSDNLKNLHNRVYLEHSFKFIFQRHSDDDTSNSVTAWAIFMLRF